MLPILLFKSEYFVIYAWYQFLHLISWLGHIGIIEITAWCQISLFKAEYFVINTWYQFMYLIS
jgi:hypothetical protein